MPENEKQSPDNELRKAKLAQILAKLDSNEDLSVDELQIIGMLDQLSLTGSQEATEKQCEPEREVASQASAVLAAEEKLIELPDTFDAWLNGLNPQNVVDQLTLAQDSFYSAAYLNENKGFIDQVFDKLAEIFEEIWELAVETSRFDDSNKDQISPMRKKSFYLQRRARRESDDSMNDLLGLVIHQFDLMITAIDNHNFYETHTPKMNAAFERINLNEYQDLDGYLKGVSDELGDDYEILPRFEDNSEMKLFLIKHKENNQAFYCFTNPFTKLNYDHREDPRVKEVPSQAKIAQKLFKFNGQPDHFYYSEARTTQPGQVRFDKRSNIKPITSISSLEDYDEFIEHIDKSGDKSGTMTYSKGSIPPSTVELIDISDLNLEDAETWLDNLSVENIDTQLDEAGNTYFSLEFLNEYPEFTQKFIDKFNEIRKQIIQSIIDQEEKIGTTQDYSPYDFKDSIGVLKHALKKDEILVLKNDKNNRPRDLQYFSTEDTTATLRYLKRLAKQLKELNEALPEIDSAIAKASNNWKDLEHFCNDVINELGDDFFFTPDFETMEENDVPIFLLKSKKLKTFAFAIPNRNYFCRTAIPPMESHFESVNQRPNMRNFRAKILTPTILRHADLSTKQFSKDLSTDFYMFLKHRCETTRKGTMEYVP